MDIVMKESPMSRSAAVLVLEDGRVYTGTAFGALGQTLGEAVFSTGMSGYQETLTDPSYHRQIVVATAPQIGNTGWNSEDGESRGGQIWGAGYAVRDPSPRVSNWRATGTLEDELIRQRVVGIAGIDTRAVVRHLRTRGSMRAGVFSGSALAEESEMLRRVCDQPAMLGADLCGEVSTEHSYIVEAQGPQRFSVVALDLGIKTNTPRNFALRGIRTHVLPSTATFEQIADLSPDGVFLSNGPGDPATADRATGQQQAAEQRGQVAAAHRAPPAASARYASGPAISDATWRTRPAASNTSRISPPLGAWGLT
jgi:carbamoyl-phosphate synthase small subunit